MDSNHDFSHFTIAVIGLGLMGGSFAKRFKAIGSRVIGINRTASVAQEALRMGIVDSISEEDLKDAFSAHRKRGRWHSLKRRSDF
jgi:prephenate dehydrogenase